MSVWGEYRAMPEWTLREKEILIYLLTKRKTHCPVILMHRTKEACRSMRRKMGLPLMKKPPRPPGHKTDMLIRTIKRMVREGSLMKEIAVANGMTTPELRNFCIYHKIRRPQIRLSRCLSTDDGYDCGSRTLDAVRQRLRAWNIPMQHLAKMLELEPRALDGKINRQKFRLTGPRLRILVEYLDGRITKAPDGGIALIWND